MRNQTTKNYRGGHFHDRIRIEQQSKNPRDGHGTFLLTPDQAENSVKAALSCGYRLIDTANAYVNERAVGRAMKASGVKREDIFLSTKLWPTVYEAEDAVQKTLDRLQTDYIDLLFIHQPAGNWLAGYRRLEKAYKAGVIRSIGISNFRGEKLKKLLAEAEIKPHLIQLEAHPYCTEADVMAELAPYGTKLMSWYPLGHGDKALLQEKVFEKLGKKYGKSAVQIILRWHMQKGFIVIPGSSNPAHVASNFEVFDFALTDGEMQEIAALDKNKKYYNATPAQEEAYANMHPDMDGQK